ncbi:MAG: hypothetical protein ACKO6N_11375 [Myxococcota bacterium]
MNASVYPAAEEVCDGLDSGINRGVQVVAVAGCRDITAGGATSVEWVAGVTGSIPIEVQIELFGHGGIGHQGREGGVEQTREGDAVHIPAIVTDGGIGPHAEAHLHGFAGEITS